MFVIKLFLLRQAIRNIVEVISRLYLILFVLNSTNCV